MGIDISEQSKVGLVFSSVRRNLPSGIQCQRITAFPEVSVRKVEYHLVRAGICNQRLLKVLDCAVVKMIAGEQYAGPSQSPVIAGTNLIELHDGASSIVYLS